MSYKNFIQVSNICLFRLDTHKMEYAQLSETPLSGPLLRIIFDSLDRHKFLLCVRDEWTVQLYRGALINATVQMEPNCLPYNLDLRSKLATLKFEGNSLSTSYFDANILYLSTLGILNRKNLGKKHIILGQQQQVNKL
jgi:hypothetical protein